VTVAYSRGQTTDALLAALRGVFGSTKVYDMIVPGTVGKMYVLVMPIDGGSTAGPGLDDPDAQIAVTYQIDCIADMRQAVQYLQDKLYGAMLGRTDGVLDMPIEIPAGRRVADRVIDSAPGGVTTSGTPPQVLFVTQDRFTLWITPSS
jgi:hypothetical protein